MRKNILNNSITTLTLGLTLGLGLAMGSAAAAQELVKSEEHRIAQESQAYFLMAPANGKLSFQAAGAATDLVVIRLADGTVFATATIEQLLKGITGDHKLPEEPKLDSKEASAGSESVDSSDRQSPDVAWKSLTGRVEILRAEFTFASIPWAFHGGSVSIYRGASELDRDMILLY